MGEPAGGCERVGDTELQVVCRGCGSEVSPYVTECPYCGARVRKRAPQLRHHDDHFEAQPTRGSRLRDRLPWLRRDRRGRGARGAGSAGQGGTGFGADSGAVRDRLGGLGRLDALGGRAVPAAIVLVSAVLLLVGVAADFSLAGIGAVAGPIEGEWWRFLTAPFAYDNVGYLFIVAVALAIFGAGLERRLGLVPAAILLFGCGALGALGGYGVASALGADGPLIAGGNGIALGAVLAWVALRHAEVKRLPEDDYDVIGVGVVAAVVLALPLVDTSADVFAGLAGGAVGGLSGMIATKLHRD